MCQLRPDNGLAWSAFAGRTATGAALDNGLLPFFLAYARQHQESELGQLLDATRYAAACQGLLHQLPPELPTL